MNKIIKKISGALQLVLMAPVKLPGQALLVLKYVAIGLGIIEKVMEKGEGDEGGDASEEGEGSGLVNGLIGEQADGGKEK